MLPELTRTFKRFFPSDEPIALKLEAPERKAAPYEIAEANWYFQNGYYSIASNLLSAFPTSAGEAVNTRTALGHPVIWACVSLISECIGFTPALLYRKTASGKVKAEDHPMYSAMQDAPNDEITSAELIEAMTAQCLLTGNGFAKILRRSGTGVAFGLSLLVPEQVTADREKRGQKRLVYIVREQGVPDKTYTVETGKPQDIFHLRRLTWDGVSGLNVTALGKETIGSALAADRNLAKLYANGGRMPYHVETTQKFASKDDSDRFRNDLQATASNPWNPIITEPWWKIVYAGTGASMRDAQGIENRVQTVSEMCRWFNVSPPLVHDLSRATFNNVEELFLQFKNFTLAKWYTAWQRSFWRCVLTPDEKEQSQKYILRHDYSELVRGDFQQRMAGYATALQNAIWSVDEVRDDMDEDPLPNGAGQHHHIQLNMQALPEDGSEIKPPQKGPKQLVRLEQDQTVQ